MRFSRANNRCNLRIHFIHQCVFFSVMSTAQRILVRRLAGSCSSELYESQACIEDRAVSETCWRPSISALLFTMELVVLCLSKP
jgi:hypothetical protein